MELFQLQVGPVALDLEQHHLQDLLQLVHQTVAATQGASVEPSKQLQQKTHQPDVSALLPGPEWGPAQEQKVYMARFSVGALDLTFSFLPAPWHSGSPFPGKPSAIVQV